MNALNLKVTGDTKKKGRKREEKEDLSPFYPQSGVTQKILDSLSCSTSMEAQISSLKGILSEYKNCSADGTEVSEVFNLFLNMVLELKTRSPLRAAILRHLYLVEDNVKPLLNARLVAFLEEKCSSTTFELEPLSQLLSFLMSWFDVAKFSFEQCGPLISSFLIRSLVNLRTLSCSEMPPSAKLLIIETLHNNVRCLITVFQKASTYPTTELYELALELMKDDQLPLDTRSNSGILLVLVCIKLFPELQRQQLLDVPCLGDDFQSMLCLYSGVLNVYSTNELEENVLLNGSETSLLDHLLKRIISSEESNPADCTLVLSASRCVLLVTKCLTLSPHLLSEGMLSALLNFVWAHLEHYMDAVRHLMSSSLTNIVFTGKKLKNNVVTDVISRGVGNMSSDKRGKHAAISALIGNLPVVSLLSKSPGLVEALLDTAKNSQSVNHVIGSYKALAAQHFHEKSSLDEWRTMWVTPLINHFMNDTPNAAFEHILGELIKLDASVVQYVARLLENLALDPSNSILFICLRIGKKHGVLKCCSDDSEWKGLADYETIRKRLCHSNGAVRLACFALIIETQKLSELYSNEELEIAKEFLKFNINNHCPAERQKSMAYFKKFLSRFKLGYDSCQRGLKKDSTTQTISVKTRFESYESFADWLIKFCIDNLFPGANFARRCTSLSLLSLCQEFGLWNERRHSEANCQALLMWFLDSYEDNKMLAKKMFLDVSPHTLRFLEPAHVKWYLDNSIGLASSVRPVDSLSAAYFVSLLASFPLVSTELLSAYPNLQQRPDIKSVPHPGRFFCLRVVLNKLKEELAIGRKNLLKAASTVPMYGQLVVLRYILRETDFSAAVDSQDWKDVIQEIISVAFECNKVVAGVVNSSSPEGHLPMDFDYDTNSLAEDPDSPKVTAQMLLLCSWRTVKEVSLLLGELSENVPISTNVEKGLISEEKILEIGEHLSGLLAETKHRGAFEQAYVGFCKLASRLWRYSKGNLHELPSRWLDETIEEISNNQNLSTTRRSAGIPFRFQALVCTELDVGGGKCFHRGIKTLLQLAGDSSSSVETKCHALNILRALYRHTLLGELVSPYVAEGLIIAIQGFNASTWAERNSSTLLLSALMTRVFGVPRSRSENLCWKNKMTGRIFFQRYPSLFGVLLNHLESASQKSLYPATYPALLILGRLYPSSLEGTDSNLQLKKYIPLVYKCSGSNILKTRVLASSAMVALITPNLFINHVDEVCSTFDDDLDENSTHGLLLQLLKLFRSSDDLPEDVINLIRLKLDFWMSRIVQTLKSERRSFVSKTACISILLLWVTRFYQDLPTKSVADVVEHLIDLISSKKSSMEMCGESVFLLYSTTFVLTADYHRQRVEQLVTTVQCFLQHSNYDVRNVCLDFLRCLLQNSTRFTLKVDDSRIGFEMSAYTSDLKRNILSSDDIARVIASNVSVNCHHEDTSALLEVARFLPRVFLVLSSRDISVVEYFVQICLKKVESLGSLAFECIASFLSSSEAMDHLTSTEVDQLCLVIDSYSTSQSENSCRSAVASFLSSHFDKLVGMCCQQNSMKIWTSALRLLNDDDFDIRTTMSSVFEPNAVPEMSTTTLMDRLVSSNFVDSIVKTCLLLHWGLWDSSEEMSVEDPADRVFDKGDMNTYVEELLLNEMACKRLELLVNEQPSLLKQELPLYCHDCLHVSSDLQCNNLAGVVRKWKGKAIEECQRGLESPFRLNEIRLSLNKQKLVNILKCLDAADVK